MTYTVTAADASTQAYTVTVTVTTPGNSLPTDILLSISRVTENKPVATVVGTLTSTDPDAGNTFTYSFCGGTDDASFRISADQLSTTAKFDADKKSSYSICIRTTDGGGLSFDKPLVAITVAQLADKNVAKNGRFEAYKVASKIPTSWKALHFTAGDGKDTNHRGTGKYSVMITGTGVAKTLTQTLFLSGAKSDPLFLQYYVMGNALSSGGTCTVQVLFYKGKIKVGTKTSKCPGITTFDWKLLKLKFTAPAAYTKIVVKITVNKAAGTLWFDGLVLKR